MCVCVLITDISFLLIADIYIYILLLSTWHAWVYVGCHVSVGRRSPRFPKRMGFEDHEKSQT